MAATKAQVDKFIKMIAPIAVAQAKKHDNKIFPSVCIAQAAHESGWGTSAKMVKANALYGIKVGKSAYHFGTAWKDKAYKTGTHEYYNGSKNATYIQDYFREYDNVSDATEDYFDMLCHCNRYKPALNQPTPQKCIEAIVKGGYATGPNYAKAIMNIINGYHLTQFDGGSIPVQSSKPTNPYKRTLFLMKRGNKGESVKWLQWMLCQLGANLSIDGDYGRQTQAAVINFQQLMNNRGIKMPVDGICGKLTIQALESNV